MGLIDNLVDKWNEAMTTTLQPPWIHRNFEDCKNWHEKFEKCLDMLHAQEEFSRNAFLQYETAMRELESAKVSLEDARKTSERLWSLVLAGYE